LVSCGLLVHVRAWGERKSGVDLSASVAQGVDKAIADSSHILAEHKKLLNQQQDSLTGLIAKRDKEASDCAVETREAEEDEKVIKTVIGSVSVLASKTLISRQARDLGYKTRSLLSNEALAVVSIQWVLSCFSNFAVRCLLAFPGCP
jgi:hypothetical protein